MSPSVKPAIVVHGGAWAIPDELSEASVAGVKLAAKCGYEVLKTGGSAIDAVSAAIQILEDDPVFDSGTGSVLTAEEKVEMDSIIMEGERLNTGAVACIENMKNPSHVARLVMEKTGHVLLVGEGANEFACAQGIPEVSPESLVTEEARRQWEEMQKFKTSVNTLFSSRNSSTSQLGHDTVGVVVVDEMGHVACCTSTGGISNKLPGRVGDSPIIGAGAYCDDNIGAVSTTGHGEAIMKICLSRHVTGLMNEGFSAQLAAEMALKFMYDKVHGCGGCIVVDKRGNIGLDFTTEKMAWAAIKGDGELKYGLNPREGYMSLLEISEVQNTVPKPLSMSNSQPKPTIVVHGGAGFGIFPDDYNRCHRNGLKQSAKDGYSILKNGGCALDAVMAAVSFMEKDPYFNAGVGSKLTRAGHIEMDALVIDGKTNKAGAVAGVKNIMHPVKLARDVMDKTDHVFLVGRGANSFARQLNYGYVEEKDLVTERSGKQWEKRICHKDSIFNNEDRVTCNSGDGEHDTVGAVALDCHGNLAVAISTGGITGKLPGRVGDSPLIGGGAYCDNDIGAVTTTGHGESIAKVCLAKNVIELMGKEITPKTAGSQVLNLMTSRLSLNKCGAGIIILNVSGDVAICNNTQIMSWACIKDSQMKSGNVDDECTEVWDK